MPMAATAKVTVTPPAAGSGYLMVESSDGPLWWQEIEVPAEGKTFDVQLDKQWARHDLYISALVIRPGERKANATPKRAVGVLHLPLARAERKLAVSLQAPEKMRPKQPLTVKIKAASADGSVAKQVHVLLSASTWASSTSPTSRPPTRSPACSAARPTVPTSWTSTAS
jgi:Large extracellular alpha-helical protein